MPRKVLLGVGAAAALVVVLLAVAWAVDGARGLELAGQEIPDDPATLVIELAAGYGERPIVVRTPGGPLETTAAEVGMAVDPDATLAAIEDAEDGGPKDWLAGLLGRRSAPVVVTVDDAAVRRVVREKDPTERTNPVEPSIVGTAEGIRVEDGTPGRGLSAAAVGEAVVDAARTAEERIEAEVEPGPLSPRFTRADAEALAERARTTTEDALAVTAGGATAEVGPATQRSWLRSTEDLELDVAADEVLADLEEHLAAAATPAEDATISIQGGRPVIVPGKVGWRCCAPEAADRIREAMRARPAGPVELPVTERQPARTSEDLRELQIVEQIGSFTTNYPAGQPRVTNIHRIAEIVDGTTIGPGGRFSVNDKVGKRTSAKGFVSGGVIENGVFAESVGGGISQFATTLFNAAFFGGLDIPEYQSHSIYISRYPYGREATLSFPKPDLVISNTTPYGVLIDTSYTGSSVTVTLWSTRHARGEQTAQTEAPVGPCTRVTTTRTRTYVDGTSKTDRFFATYRPEEGVKC